MSEINHELNIETGECKITGDFEFTGNIKDKDFPVKMGLAQLRTIQEKRNQINIPDTTELAEDIAAYEWILAEDLTTLYVHWKADQKSKRCQPRDFREHFKMEG